jgi:hypothetical protein
MTAINSHYPAAHTPSASSGGETTKSTLASATVVKPGSPKITGSNNPLRSSSSSNTDLSQTGTSTGELTLAAAEVVDLSKLSEELAEFKGQIGDNPTTKELAKVFILAYKGFKNIDKHVNSLEKGETVKLVSKNIFSQQFVPAMKTFGNQLLKAIEPEKNNSLLSKFSSTFQKTDYDELYKRALKIHNSYDI